MLIGEWKECGSISMPNAIVPHAPPHYSPCPITPFPMYHFFNPHTTLLSPHSSPFLVMSYPRISPQFLLKKVLMPTRHYDPLFFQFHAFHSALHHLLYSLPHHPSPNVIASPLPPSPSPQCNSFILTHTTLFNRM